LLKRAEKLLKEYFEDEGSTEEEIEEELAHIRVLQAYCCQRQGKQKEAYQIYVNCLQLKLEDPALVAVASNNVVTINKDKNVFDSKKKMKAAMLDAALAKLPMTARKVINLNNAIFYYYSNMNDQSDKLCANILKEWPEFEVKTKVLNALNAKKLKPDSDPLKILTGIKAKTPDDDLFLKLTCVQLLLMNGEREQACKILRDLGDNTYQPGIVGALITLYTNLGKESEAVEIYEKAIEWHKSREKTGKYMENFYKQASEFHLRNGKPEAAAKSLEQLRDLQPQNKKIIAKLVLAYAMYDTNSATKLSASLGNVADYKSEIDVTTLESNTWLTAKKTAAPTPKSEMSPGDAETKRKRSRRKKKGKLPKNYDPNVPPDPERWLPKYERSGYRKKRDRRAKEIIKGSQGTTAGQSDQYDFSKHTVEQEDSPVSAEPTPSQKGIGRQQQKKGNSKKKGGKRR